MSFSAMHERTGAGETRLGPVHGFLIAMAVIVPFWIIVGTLIYSLIEACV